MSSDVLFCCGTINYTVAVRVFGTIIGLPSDSTNVGGHIDV
uniref:Uncharacterized protein n=1 Tax=Arundo donax TaxID=35708 RepID=A0A0A8ZTP7_ARUDO